MTTVTLDGFVFEDFEIPESMTLGGDQALAIHRMAGGKRVIDAMGGDPRPISWSGRFRGPLAMSRAMEIDAKRIAGKKLALSWGVRSFTVVIERFDYEEQAVNEIPYEIRCEVVTDDTTASIQGDIGVDEMVDTDASSIDDLADDIEDAPLTSAVDKVKSAISNVRDFAKATRQQVNSVLQPLRDVKQVADELLDDYQGAVMEFQGIFLDVQDTIGSVQTTAGEFESTVNSMVSAITGQADALDKSADLFDLTSYSGRMQTNLLAIGSSGAEVVTAGGDLYALATQKYGDPNEWTTIAEANGLTDPMLSGVQTVLVPPIASGSGGVLKV